MGYDFDEIIDRRGTSCIKYDFAKERGLPEDVLPMWVADMDFRAPPEVVDALTRVAVHGIFGYSESKDEYFAPLRDWFARRLGWTPEREWLKKTPGVVYAINAALRAFTRRGDAVIVQSPVYYPFFSSVRANGRLLVDSPLAYGEGGAYTVDFVDFERKVKEFRPKMFLLCSPHNPVGRVWTDAELDTLAGICLKHGTLVFSDEIHCDFAWGGRSHRVLASLSRETAGSAILATAPSKTFNLAGLMISNVFIPDRTLRREFASEVERTGLSQLSVMGLAAGAAAYRYGEPWLEALKAYLEATIAFVRGFVAERLPGVRLVEPEGTYLLWLDFRALGLPHEEVCRKIVHEARLWLDDGLIFGEAGRHFQRINMAAPLATVKEALERLERVFFG
ncbi:MAG: pyridoxal phosphate-dependent aminotransferase [Deltaproteobacteria bacterium]|jgi:cystathionine beta-lyase|nr:pyridoxal phosphate-dependent aminotransferase [Deltaproteobacteria bacterium]